jgi:hybrid cluster-associated redox disulfide protein
MTKKKLITGEMTIQEIIELYPFTMEIFAEWGLGCATCHIGAFETVEEGALAHGFSAEEVDEILDDLNTMAEEEKKEKERREKEMS